MHVAVGTKSTKECRGTPPLYMGKMGSICHFPRALHASIWGYCSQVLFFTSIWGTHKRGVTMTLFVLFFLASGYLRIPKHCKIRENAKWQIDPALPSHTPPLHENQFQKPLTSVCFARPFLMFLLEFLFFLKNFRRSRGPDSYCFGVAISNKIVSVHFAFRGKHPSSNARSRDFWLKFLTSTFFTIFSPRVQAQMKTVFRKAPDSIDHTSVKKRNT